MWILISVVDNSRYAPQSHTQSIFKHIGILGIIGGLRGRQYTAAHDHPRAYDDHASADYHHPAADHHCATAHYHGATADHYRSAENALND